MTRLEDFNVPLFPKRSAKGTKMLHSQDKIPSLWQSLQCPFLVSRLDFQGPCYFKSELVGVSIANLNIYLIYSIFGWICCGVWRGAAPEQRALEIIVKSSAIAKSLLSDYSNSQSKDSSEKKLMKEISHNLWFFFPQKINLSLFCSHTETQGNREGKR